MQLLLNGARREWWREIWQKMLGGLSIVIILISFFVSLLILTIVLYLAGIVVVGRKRATFSDAFTISLIGTVLSTLFGIFLPWLIALILEIFVWLLLIKRLYETRWLGAIVVGILAIIIYLGIITILLLFAAALI
jgi:hypothetical protein